MMVDDQPISQSPQPLRLFIISLLQDPINMNTLVRKTAQQSFGRFYSYSRFKF